MQPLAFKQEVHLVQRDRRVKVKISSHLCRFPMAFLCAHSWGELRWQSHFLLGYSFQGRRSSTLIP